jgi:hypothetical protein
MSDDLASQSDRLLGRLKQLQTRHSTLIRDVCAGELTVTVEFYLADVAIDATHCLLEAGITAVHRMHSPCVTSFQLPSLLAQNQIPLAVQTLDAFLQRHTLGAKRPVSLRSEE